MDLSAEPNGQHVPLLTRQLLLFSASLPSRCLAHAPPPPLPCTHTLIFTHFHSFSLFIANSPFCGGGVGGVFASHMAVPGASGADVLGIGALLQRAHAYTHIYIHTGLRGACY